MPYDIENFTFSYTYNQEDHSSFEIEESLDQNVRLGGTYNYSFRPKPYEPFKENDSIFRSKYWQFLKDLNFNYVPNNIAVSSNINRQYTEQKFRELNTLPGNIGLPRLYQRNYLFDWQYAINYNLSRSLRFNFDASNNSIVTNYIDDGGLVDNSIGIWDGFFDVGKANQHFQTLQLNYDLPFDKFPYFRFVKATYTYQGDFQWTKTSDLFNQIDITLRDGTTNTYRLGNTIQNSSSHRVNSTLDMNNLYRYLGLTKITPRSKAQKARRESQRNAASDKNGGNTRGQAGDKGNDARTAREDGPSILGGQGGQGQQGGPNANQSQLTAGDKAKNTVVDIVTMVKRVQLNYQENQGTFLPGYLPSVGMLGTLKPGAFVFGSQADIRREMARRGWLTVYPEFNEQYTEVESRQFDYQANLEPISDLKIDLNGSRIYAENYVENYIVEDGRYRSLTPNTFGNFNISTMLIGTAFGKSDENSSQAFDDFRANRLVIADRLATEFYGSTEFPRDEEGFPIGFGKTSQDVLLPAFLSAYKGSDPSKEKTTFLRDFPIPNWDVKYTGLMNLKWFKEKFRRFSIQHGYRANYTVNQFQTNLDYNRFDPTEVDVNGNIKPQNIFSNVNLTEQFSPLVRIDFEMKNSVKILAEYRKDRFLSLSFANNLMTEVKGDEIIIGAGYRIRDLRIGTNFGGKRTILKSDLNFQLDVSRRDNRTIIRYLDINNNQTTAGQTIWGIQFTVDYALSKNLTALFYYDHTFSKYAVSTAFPQTTIRSGITLRYNFGN